MESTLTTADGRQFRYTLGRTGRVHVWPDEKITKGGWFVGWVHRTPLTRTWEYKVGASFHSHWLCAYINPWDPDQTGFDTWQSAAEALVLAANSA